jgi:two-component system response regulator AtoC
MIARVKSGDHFGADDPTWDGRTELDPIDGVRCRRILVAMVQGEALRFELPATDTAPVLLTLGRSRSNSIALFDPTVSRQHATLECRGAELWLRRAPESRASIRVGTSKIESDQPVQVASGVSFALGDVVLVVREEREPAKRESGARSEGGIVFRSAAMESVVALARRVGASELSVLVTGETGSGKELVARLVHDSSGRARMPYVAINCAALPANLLEAELFGYERGAFSGAVTSKPGLFEAANGGTLLLDEIGELALEVQAKLLRVLDRRELLRLGSVKPRPVDVRVVSATHRDLGAMVEAGAFRRDLFFRIHGMTVNVPPLALHFAKVALRGGRASITPQALDAMLACPWAGNVRELRSTVERALVLSGTAVIDAEHLRSDGGPLVVALPSVAPVAPEARADEGAAPREQSLRDELRALERARIVEALERCGNNQSRAAELLGMPRRTLVARLSELGLTGRARGRSGD